MTVTLREITSDNFRECVHLKVRDDQPFVASNVYSIAQSKVEPEFIPMAIYADDRMVGFMMYACFYEQKKLYLCRFMIDQQYQHRGYGKAALDLLKQVAMDDPGIDFMELSTAPDNAYGIRVYEKFGFKDTGVLDDEEEVFIMDLEKKARP